MRGLNLRHPREFLTACSHRYRVRHRTKTNRSGFKSELLVVDVINPARLSQALVGCLALISAEAPRHRCGGGAAMGAATARRADAARSIFNPKAASARLLNRRTRMRRHDTLLVLKTVDEVALPSPPPKPSAH
ncbi:hypothetical protein Kim5_PA00049 (plasmid) [Rhizobium sp. Kim5]|nr:hypothetical protein Kim5_PA00049 [Rhizobium sp. Kim5]